MARYGHNHGGGRPKGSKNKSTGNFQDWYRSMCQRVLQNPKVEQFYADVVADNPIDEKWYEVKDPKTGLYVQKKRMVRLDAKLRIEILRDLRDGSGCKPILLLEGDKGGNTPGQKPSFNISISVV